jgi:predicted CXXCH cytochrome family protein
MLTLDVPGRIAGKGERPLRFGPSVAIFPLLLSAAFAADNYVDPKLCAGCHAEIAKTYAKTGMGRSFFAMQPQRVVEDFSSAKPFYHAPSDMYYQMLERGGSYFQRRWQIGPGDKEINVEEKRIDFVMGSGNHARTYLHLTPRNTLQQLPLGWYAENGGYFAMNPGYDRPDYPGSTRTISYECMSCHNAYPRIPAGHEAEGSEAQFVAPLPQGIDCQRCHGPGREHVETSGKAAIINPKRLNADREIEVCLQCHLETTTQSLPHSIQRTGRGPFSYVPGQPLADFRLTFDRAVPNKNRVEVAHAGYRLRMSQCFLKSAGKLRCTTCHDPHNIPRGEAATTQYNRICRDCHTAVLANTAVAPRHTAAADCVSCHMPKRRTDDAVHIVMTDHWIQRRKPAGNLLAAKPEIAETPANMYRGEVVPYYPAALTASPRDVLDRAVAQVRDGSNLKAGLPRLAALVTASSPAEYHIDLADAYRLAFDGPRALREFEQARARDPKSVIVLLKLGNMLLDMQRWAEAEAVARSALQLSPDDPVLLGQLGWAQWQQDKTAEAKASLEKAIRLDPELPDLHNYLAKLYIGTRDAPSAEREFRAALAIQPGVAEWQENLATLLGALGNLDEAAYHFQETVKLKPGYAPGHLGYARLLAGMRRNTEAEQQAQAAVSADPNAPDAHEMLGFLLVNKGDGNGALRELQAAVRLQPAFGRAQYELGVVLYQKGDTAAAIEHLKAAIASQDREAQSAAQQFLQKVGR